MNILPFNCIKFGRDYAALLPLLILFPCFDGWCVTYHCYVCDIVNVFTYFNVNILFHNLIFSFYVFYMFKYLSCYDFKDLFIMVWKKVITLVIWGLSSNPYEIDYGDNLITIGLHGVYDIISTFSRV
jgi:hypothetical protein